MNYAVIMAGGTGKRLWPLSRQARPKQVLKLLDGQTLLRRCFERISPIFDSRNIIVLTNAGYADIIRENLPEIPDGNVIAEPAVRDTAGAIGLAATILSKYDPQATMAVVTADHVIKPEEIFQKTMTDAITFINHNPEALVTFGITPSSPSTQLGYLRLGGETACSGVENKIYRLLEFREKPDLCMAQKYLGEGNYCWNSGMFVWKARTILSNLQRFLPACIEPLGQIHAAWDGPGQEQAMREWFVKLPKISIDFAVMEKAENVYVIKLTCDWLDMGSFIALADITSSDEQGNIVAAGYSRLLDSRNNIVVTEDREHLIAMLGVENMVVAHSPDATLICRKDDTDRLKELLELIRNNGMEKFL